MIARLLTPREYGLAGMALVFSALALVFADLGLGSALVRRQSITEQDRSTAFWLNVAAGLVLAALGIAASEPLARFYGEPVVRDLFIALSVGFLITSLATTQSALLTRELYFGRTQLAATTATLSAAVVAISLATDGHGPWAVVGGSLAGTITSTVLLWIFSPWRPHLTFSRESLRTLGAFGGKLFGSRLLFYVHRNADNLLVGRFLGAAPLGAYALAYNLILLPFARIVDPVRSVLFPALSRIQDDRERVAELWLRGTRVLAAVLVPAMLGLIVVAPDAVDVVLGERWSDAVPVIQVLAVVGALQSAASLNSVVLPVLDRAGLLLAFSLVTVLVSLAGFAVGLAWGIVGVAAGYLVANLIVVPLYTALTARALGISVRRFLSAVAGIVQASLGMLACIAALQAGLVAADVPAGARLLLVVVAGLGVFLALAAWRSRELLAEVRKLRGRSNSI